MDYNTQREKLILPEYGRYIQNMVEEAVQIQDREKRTRQVKAIVNAMSALNPQLREMNDYYHKLWDHVHIIADYKLDVDSPFPPP
jgi:N-glycosylase/DNA lyase